MVPGATYWRCYGPGFPCNQKPAGEVVSPWYLPHKGQTCSRTQMNRIPWTSHFLGKSSRWSYLYARPGPLLTCMLFPTRCSTPSLFGMPGDIRVQFIPKPGAKTLQPVSLTSAFFQLFEMLIWWRLEYLAEHNNWIPVGRRNLFFLSNGCNLRACGVGVPESGVLFPLLFNLALKKIRQHLLAVVEVAMHAEDLLLYITGSSISETSALLWMAIEGLNP